LFFAVLLMRVMVSDGAAAVSKRAEPEDAPSAPVVAAAAAVAITSAPQVKRPAIAVATRKTQPARPKAAQPQRAARKDAAPKVSPKVVAAKAAPSKPRAMLTSPKSAAGKRAAKPVAKGQQRLVRVTTAPVARAPRTGTAMATLRVNSLPWSEVFVDGNHVGNTPQTNLPLPAGRHKIKLVNTQLQMSKSFPVELKPGQVVTKTINLAP
jgi:serine/threonine-protein kinase